MAEHSATTITTAETPQPGLSSEQRFLIVAGTYDLLHDELAAKLTKYIAGDKEAIDPDDKEPFDRLNALSHQLHELATELIATLPDGKLWFLYAQAGMALAQHRAECYRQGLRIAHREQTLDPTKPVDAGKIAGQAWLQSGMPRQYSADYVNTLKELEMQIGQKGYRTISIQEFDETLGNEFGMPRAIYTKMFKRRAPGEKAVRHALNLKKEHPALAIQVGGKKSGGKRR